MPTVSDHRPATIVAIEIQAARWAFLRADEAGDYALADDCYATLDRLLDEYSALRSHHAYIPPQRQP